MTRLVSLSRSLIGSGLVSLNGRSDGPSLVTDPDIETILALSPSILIWPEKGAGWQTVTGGSLVTADAQNVGLLPDLSQLGGATLAEYLAFTGYTSAEFLDGTAPGRHLKAGTWASGADADRPVLARSGKALNMATGKKMGLRTAISVATNQTVIAAVRRPSNGTQTFTIANAAGSRHAFWWWTDNLMYSSPGATEFNSGGTVASTGNNFVITTKRNSGGVSVLSNGVERVGGGSSTASGSYDSTQFAGNASGHELSFLAVFPSELSAGNTTTVQNIAKATNGASF
ncbi:MAG: hypothetical protein B7Z37_24020 [Verrucomicrobia bacterium 12-59-8]|nr:MAG: hypothetical protein B7Z37_24020 [Verrucomicrobia bacterium 12-59-8]